MSFWLWVRFVANILVARAFAGLAIVASSAARRAVDRASRLNVKALKHEGTFR